MQVTQAVSSKSERAGEDEFTYPSTLNYNKMKKFIQSKINHNETTSVSTPSSETDSYSPCNMSKQERVMPEVQPPLPLDPPPMDKPPNMNLTLKKEIEDIEYSPGEEISESLNHGLGDYKSNDGDDTDKPKTMCRDFIRGKCVRQGTCKFSHKCDISQLVGVYTFCKNFQNAVCTFPNCKYVHATVFEEQHFYRTAELPPHALAHHKKQMNMLPPPPPPPEEPPAPINMQFIFNNPPPPLPFRIERPPPVISVIPASKMEARHFPDVRDALPAGSNPLKREWTCIEHFPGSSRDLEADSERLQKRCKTCKYYEMRTEFIKEKCEKLKKAKIQAQTKLELLNKKRERLYATLMTIFRPLQAKHAVSGSIAAPNIGERQKWLLDQMSNAMNSNIITGIQEDPNRYSMNGNQNLSSLVAKLLNVYRQHILTADASRKS